MDAHLDIEKLIGRLVIEHEMTRARAMAERRDLLEKIEGLRKELTSKNPSPDDSSQTEPLSAPGERLKGEGTSAPSLPHLQSNDKGNNLAQEFYNPANIDDAVPIVTSTRIHIAPEAAADFVDFLKEHAPKVGLTSNFDAPNTYVVHVNPVEGHFGVNCHPVGENAGGPSDI